MEVRHDSVSSYYPIISNTLSIYLVRLSQLSHICCKGICHTWNYLTGTIDCAGHIICLILLFYPHINFYTRYITSAVTDLLQGDLSQYKLYYEDNRLYGSYTFANDVVSNIYPILYFVIVHSIIGVIFEIALYDNIF